MKFYDVLQYLIAIPIFALLTFKFLALTQSFLWACRHGSSYADELFPAVQKWNEHGFSSQELNQIRRQHNRVSIQDNPFIRRIVRSLPRKLRLLLSEWVFRLTPLIVLQVLLLMTLSNKILLVFGIGLLWMSLWAYVLHILATRLALGYMDSYFGRTVTFYRYAEGDGKRGVSKPSRRKIVRDFAILFAAVLALVVFGYAGVYTGLNTLMKPHQAFVGLDNGSHIPFDLLYFSIVTVATVGFGDVYPDHHATLVRIAVASQILIGFSLVVLLLTCFTCTLEPEEHVKRVNE